MSVTVKHERDYNIDALRILSMFMVLMLHCGYYGGLYDRAYTLGGVNIYTLWFNFVNSICSVSVNLYILISGYYLSAQNFRISKLLRLVGEIWFYSWLIFVIRLFIEGAQGIDIKIILSAVFPVSYVQYWFTSTYAALFVLSPVLNLFIRSINIKQHLGVIVILVCLFSVLHTVFPLSQVMGVRRFGQSLPWFTVLYVIGSFLRKYVRNCQTHRQSIRIFWICILFMNITSLVSTLFVESMSMDINNEKIRSMIKYYFSFDSLPNLIASIALFQWFRGICINKILAQKLIAQMTPLILGVYLIHCHPYTRDFVWIGITQINLPMEILPLYAFIYTIFLYVVCLMLDCVRYNLCSMLKFKSLFEKIDKNIVQTYDKLYNGFVCKAGNVIYKENL